MVRTVLGVDEKNQSMTFAGDMPEELRAQLMMANHERLLKAAEDAAQQASQPHPDGVPVLAISVSCFGRKLVLGQRTDEELQATQEALTADAHQIGFYSYGEMSPAVETGCSELHNQTMTVTTISEV